MSRGLHNVRLIIPSFVPAAEDHDECAPQLPPEPQRASGSTRGAENTIDRADRGLIASRDTQSRNRRTGICPISVPLLSQARVGVISSRGVSYIALPTRLAAWWRRSSRRLSRRREQLLAALARPPRDRRPAGETLRPGPLTTHPRGADVLRPGPRLPGDGLLKRRADQDRTGTRSDRVRRLLAERLRHRSRPARVRLQTHHLQDP